MSSRPAASLALLTVGALLCAGCTGAAAGSGAASGGSGPAPSPVDPAVVQALQSYGGWTASDHPPFEDGRTLTAQSWVNADNQQVTCTPAAQPRTVRPGSFDSFPTFPFSGDVLPGVIVQGGLVEKADLRVLPLDRAPMRLRVDLDSGAPAVTVDEPTPSSLQEAVGQLARDADARLTGLPVVPADVRLSQSEASSYEEAVLDMGVSLRYDSPGLRARFGSSFEQKSKQERHSVVARLMQPMYTISVDRSGIRNAGSYLRGSVSTADLDELVSQGRLGPGNPPVLVDSVTYGRVVYMTVTSTKGVDASEIKAAISGSYGGFSGDASVAKRNKRILEESEIQIDVIGGNDAKALAAGKAALTSGTIAEFLEAVDTSTAKPLTMVLRTLDGAKLQITDEAKVTDVACTRSAQARKAELQIDLGGGAIASLYVNGRAVKAIETSQRLDMSRWIRQDTDNRIELWYRPPTCISGSMAVTFLVDGSATRQWRAAGNAGRWVCDSTSAWRLDKAGKITFLSGTVS